MCFKCSYGIYKIHVGSLVLTYDALALRGPLPMQTFILIKARFIIYSIMINCYE